MKTNIKIHMSKNNEIQDIEAIQEKNLQALLDWDTTDILNEYESFDWLKEESQAQEEFIEFFEAKNEDIKELDDVEDILLDVTQLESTEKKQLSAIQKILKTIAFLLRYTLAASFIFVVLLSVTNYSAYMSIAKSYLAPESIKKSEESINQWLESAKIVSTIDLQQKSIPVAADAEAPDKPEAHVYDLHDIMGDIESEDVDLWIEIIPFVNRIVIPKIGKNIPLLDIEQGNVENFSELNNIFMDELEDWVVRYPGSAKPGWFGNSFVFGHSSNFPWVAGDYNDVFALLDRLDVWDEIVSYYAGQKYTYRIKEKKVINPNDVSILKRDKWLKEMTLMTCWPIWTTYNRLLVIWELIEE